MATISDLPSGNKSIAIRCNCGRKLKAPESMRGKQAKCPACGQLVTIPASSDDDVIDWIGPPAASHLKTKNRSDSGATDSAAPPPPLGTATPQSQVSNAPPAPPIDSMPTEWPTGAALESDPVMAPTLTPVLVKPSDDLDAKALLESLRTLLFNRTFIGLGTVLGIVTFFVLVLIFNQVKQLKKSTIVEKGIVAARANWDLAISCFSAALKSDPENAEWLARRGGAIVPK